jgi:orotidine-5'-phosphate decarboxylase
MGKSVFSPVHKQREVSDLLYCGKMEKTSQEKNSNIVLALDFPYEKPENRTALFKRAERILNEAQPYICAVKFNHHLTLPLGLFDRVQKLVQTAHEKGMLTIMDCKANDIGATNATIAQYYYAAGFDAIIANPFTGWDEGLKPIFDVASRKDRGVILLVYMSHKGAKEGYGQTIIEAENGAKTLQYVSFAKKALKYHADGAVVGATYPEKIKEIHKILGEKVPIYSPGIGAQGATVETAAKAGSRYLIVGREITLSENSAEAAKKVRNLSRSSKPS